MSGKAEPKESFNMQKTLAIAIAQQKGGTGKTTTAAAIGAGLARRGAKILFVDLDPQANLTFIAKAQQDGLTALDVLAGARATEAIQHTKTADVIAATPNLAGTDGRLTGNDRAYRLKQALEDVKWQYDYIVIDTPPALGLLTINAFTAADTVIIPCLADVFSIQATAGIASTLKAIQGKTNTKLKVAGILVTKYNPRQIITRDTVTLLEKSAAAIGTKVFKTKIRDSVAVREAQISQTDLFSYAPKSTSALDYAALLDELSADLTSKH